MGRCMMRAMTIRRGLALLPVLGLVVLATACGAAAVATPTPAPVATEAATAGAAEDASWGATAADHRDAIGEQFSYNCPAGGEAHTVWGSDVYTDDSSVCTAGVHAGVITIEDGGRVTIEMRPGQDSYDATERNGIETRSYPEWGGSYVIVTD